MSSDQGAPAACGVCSSPCGDDAYLCRVHTESLTAELRDVPDLFAELDVTVTRQNRTTAERNGGRSSTRPLPWNEHASEARTELWATLNAWALDVAALGEDERDHLADVDEHDVGGVARWLVRNISTLRLHPEAGTAHSQIVGAIHRARSVVDRPPDRVFAGPCGATPEGQGEPCREDLYGLPGKPHTRCPVCATVHDMAFRREWMLTQIEDVAAHSGELSALLTSQGVPIGSSTIRKWATSANAPLKVVSVDTRGRKYYRIGDVLDLVLKREPAAVAS